MLSEKGVSIAEFMAELQQLAKTCNFGDCLDTSINQFVCGLNDTMCQNRHGRLDCSGGITKDVSSGSGNPRGQSHEGTLSSDNLVRTCIH